MCLTVRGSDCSIFPGLASSENDTQTSDGSPWINSANELSGDSNGKIPAEKELQRGQNGKALILLVK